MSAVRATTHQQSSAYVGSHRVVGRVRGLTAPTALTVTIGVVLVLTGCAAKHHGIPARSFPNVSQTACCGQDEPINFLMLRQDPPDSYRIAARDVLGIYIEGILGDRDAPPPVHFPDDDSQQPAIGYPTPVRDDGTISLPLVAPIQVEGQTLPEVERAILERYSQAKILLEERQRIIVTLMKRRTYQVLVIREDQGVPLTNLNSESMIVGTNKRGMSYAVDLPAYENDVLHALSETGGLPGHDAKNELIVLRGGFDPERSRRDKMPLLLNPVSGEEIVFDGDEVETDEITESDALPLNAEPIPGEKETGDEETGDEETVETLPRPRILGEPAEPSPGISHPLVDVQQYLALHQDSPNIIRIPLRLHDSQVSQTLSKQDIVLKTGDIVFVQSREKEVFYTGGVLPGGQHPLPRDYQIDVLEAIALAGGSVGPKTGGNAQVFTSARSAVFPATRVIVLRRRGHQQIPIEVNLKRAFRDPRERIQIEPGDFITLEYRPREFLGNMLLSTLHLSWFVSSIN